MKRIAPAVALVLLLASVGLAQVQLTRVTGTVVNASGVAVPNARLTITKVLKGGVVVSSRPVSVTADSSGAVSFDVLRNSVAYIEGAVVGFEREGGVPVTIPDASTATFESLVPIASVPTSNLLTHAAMNASSSQKGHIQCGTGVTCVGGVISVSTVAALDDLTDVSVNSSASGQVLRFNGSLFVNSAIQAGDLPSAIDAAKIADGSVSNTELQRLDGVTSGVQAQLDAKAAAADLTTHTSNTSNPHSVTKAQVGLGVVDNTADASKPVSTLQQAAIDSASTADRDRANHTGTQAVSTVTGLQAALDAKASATDLTTEASTRSSADTTLQTNITAEASTRATADTTLQANIDAEAAARASAITSASTADRARSNHTGTQTLSTISDAGTAAALNAPASGNAASGEVVKGSDTRLTDARTPAAHASSHAAAGSDPLTLSESQVTNLTTDLAGKQASLGFTPANVAGDTFTGSVGVTRAGIGTTPTDGLLLTNTTAAAAGAQQFSPRFRFSARGWKTTATAASQQIDFFQQLVPVQGAANPGFYSETKVQFNSGGYVRSSLLGYAPAVTVNGMGNTFYGYTAGQVNNEDVGTAGGYNNTFLGGESGRANTTGFQNTFVGSRSGFTNITGNQNTFVGQGAGYSFTGSDSVAFGYHALLNNTASGVNTAVGTQAGESTAGASTSANNTFVGYQVGKNNLSASTGNSCVGHLACTNVSSGVYNTTLGYFSGKLVTTGGGNTLVGREAGAALTTQSDNTFVGKLAGQVSTGTVNTFLGGNAGIVNSTGTGNTFVGFQAGYTASSGNANTTGGSNTFVGHNAGPGTSTQLTNSTAVGAGATVSANNTVVLGDTSVTQVCMSGGVCWSRTAGAPAGACVNGSLNTDTTNGKLYACEAAVWVAK